MNRLSLEPACPPKRAGRPGTGSYILNAIIQINIFFYNRRKSAERRFCRSPVGDSSRGFAVHRQGFIPGRYDVREPKRGGLAYRKMRRMPKQGGRLGMPAATTEGFAPELPRKRKPLRRPSDARAADDIRVGEHPGPCAFETGKPASWHSGRMGKPSSPFWFRTAIAAASPDESKSFPHRTPMGFFFRRISRAPDASASGEDVPASDRGLPAPELRSRFGTSPKTGRVEPNP